MPARITNISFLFIVQLIIILLLSNVFVKICNISEVGYVVIHRCGPVVNCVGVRFGVGEFVASSDLWVNLRNLKSRECVGRVIV